MRNALRSLVGVLAFCFVAACSQTGIRKTALTSETNLPRPSRIVVYDFAVSEQEVKEYQGIMRQQPAIKDPAERERLLAQEVKDALAGELVDGLKSLGFVVERVQRGTRATGNEMVIDGHFLTVDEGNPLHSLVIGFGSGTTYVQTQVQVYQAPAARKIMEFTNAIRQRQVARGGTNTRSRRGGAGWSDGRNGCRQCHSRGSQDLQIRCCPDGGGQWRSSGALLIGIFCETGLD